MDKEYGRPPCTVPLARRFVIYDIEDCTYHLGEGQWAHSREAAWEYATRANAEAGLDDVDCDKILRHRLVILERAIAQEEVRS